MNSYIHQIMSQAYEAFQTYQFTSGTDKKTFLYTIANEIERLGDILPETAARESNLPVVRFAGERERTCNVFRMFGDLVAEGSWVEAVIDHQQSGKHPLPKPDMRKMSVPLGPIVVFGASNFPLAYATPGGDTASALAAGCSVIVKGHPLHPETSGLVEAAIQKAIEKCNIPEHTFQLVNGNPLETGRFLTEHPLTAGIGFTGSLSGGKAIYDYARNREVPIPVFAEMGSVNPVILLPQALIENAPAWAKSFADAINIGVGQFCTRPGIQLGIKSPELDNYIEALAGFMAQKKNHNMLSKSIHQNYSQKLKNALQTKDVQTVYHHPGNDSLSADIVLAKTDGDTFEAHPHLHGEIFGPYSIIVACNNCAQLIRIWKSLKGQLSTTIIGTETDLKTHKGLINTARNIAGRIVFNMTPTGVEVGNATVHGGPYPATTDPRFTSVGMDAIKRWARPVCYQDCPDELLPDELKNGNPLNILRKTNGLFSRE